MGDYKPPENGQEVEQNVQLEQDEPQEAHQDVQQEIEVEQEEPHQGVQFQFFLVEREVQQQGVQLEHEVEQEEHQDVQLRVEVERTKRSFGDFNGRPGPAVKEKHSIVWFRNDLRLHDNEVLTTANHQSSTLLPIYIFDPRDYSTRACRFSKIGPFRAQFILESVRNLRRNLERLGSKLFVRIGRPEEIIPSIVKRISATEVYCQEEYSKENVQRQNSLSDALGEMGVRLKKLSSSTMYHKEDLPFKIDSLPSTFGEFAKQVKSVCIREALKAPNELKTIPKTMYSTLLKFQLIYLDVVQS
eukprot:g8052.t1